ncbi:MFS transporter [Caballeronia sp. DA-9]|uniref:MFS transporter n=1 Tax=Caballeronia sp. DA-9 TaxID=3436237 RepID=UPI003F66FAAF
MKQTPVAGSEPFPSASAAWYATFVFIVAATLAFVDKSVIVLMVQPIRHALMISDTGISLLQGLSFALIYSLLGLPAGHVVDKYRRREFLAGGVALWSIMTALCGLATNYTELFAARVGVGIGEAVLMPAIFSMLADFFPPKSRGRAAGVFTISTFAGGQGAFIIGGYVLKRLHGAAVAWPVLGTLQAWQSAFVIVGLPGLLVALLVMTVREPIRQRGAADLDGFDSKGGEYSLVGFLKSRRNLWVKVFGSFSFTAFAAFALLAWLPTYFIRKFGLPASSAGVMIGAVVGPAGILGCIFSGAFSDFCRARFGGDRGRFLVLILSFLVCIPCMAFLPFCATPSSALATCGLFGLFNAMATASMPVILQDLTPNRMRGKVTAVHLLLVSLIGMGLGPLVVALLTDRMFHNDADLPLSLGLTIVPGLAIALVLSIAAMRGSAGTSENDGRGVTTESTSGLRRGA